MRNLKKVLALVLAFSMMLSVVAFASYQDVPADADYAGAVELLSALNIIKGDDLGNFNPDNTITRAEFAAVVCRAKGLENAATGAAGTTAFTDVAADHWASGYINLATQNGIINGYGDGTFGPEDKVTYEQAVKMLVCALGFEPMAANKGGYPTGYLVIANQYKITAGVTATAEAPRKTVAKLVYNALSTPMMDQTSYGTDAKWEVLDGKNDRDYATLLTDMDIYIATGTVGSKISGEDSVEFYVKESSDDYEFGYYPDGATKSDGYENIIYENDYIELEINGSNILNYKNQYVDVYVEKDSSKDYNVLAVVPSTMGESITINSDDIDYDNCKSIGEGSAKSNAVDYFIDSKNTKTLKLEDSVRLEINEGEAKTIETTLELFSELGIDITNEDDRESQDIELTFIENDGNSKYDTIVALKYTSERVDSVDADRDRMELKSTSIKFDFDDDTVQIYLVDEAGNALELSDFEEDDCVAWYSDTGKTGSSKYEYLKVIKLTNSAITGTVTEISTDNETVWIDGVEYDVAYDMIGEIDNEDEGTFFIGMTGKIIDFDGSSASKDYAYILEAGVSTSTFSDAWELKLLTQKDGVVTYTLTDDASEDFEKVLVGDTGKTYKELLGIGTKTQVLFGNDDWHTPQIGNEYRFITFKTNSTGKIKSVKKAEGSLNDIKSGSQYKVATQKIDSKTLEDDAVVYNIDASSVDSVYTTDISALVDEGEYEGYVFKDKDGDYVAMIVTSDAGQLSDDIGFAVVTQVRKGKNDGEDIVTVSYVQDEEEGTVVFDDDSETIAGTHAVEPEDLAIGDIIMFNADSSGVVNKYAVLAQINGSRLLTVYEDTLKMFSDDNEFYYGYIVNTKKETKSKGENLTIMAGSNTAVDITIQSSTSRYTYNDANSRNKTVEIGDFMDSTNTEYYDKDNNTSTMVFVRVVEDDVMDIYSFDKRVTIEDDGTVAGDVKTLYVVGHGDTVQKFSAKEIEEVAAPVVEDAIVEEEVVVEEAAETVVID